MLEGMQAVAQSFLAFCLVAILCKAELVELSTMGAAGGAGATSAALAISSWSTAEARTDRVRENSVPSAALILLLGPPSPVVDPFLLSLMWRR